MTHSSATLPIPDSRDWQIALGDNNSGELRRAIINAGVRDEKHAKELYNYFERHLEHGDIKQIQTFNNQKLPESSREKLTQELKQLNDFMQLFLPKEITKIVKDYGSLKWVPPSFENLSESIDLEVARNIIFSIKDPYKSLWEETLGYALDKPPLNHVYTIKTMLKLQDEDSGINGLVDASEWSLAFYPHRIDPLAIKALLEAGVKDGRDAKNWADAKCLREKERRSLPFVYGDLREQELKNPKHLTRADAELIKELLAAGVKDGKDAKDWYSILQIARSNNALSEIQSLLDAGVKDGQDAKNWREIFSSRCLDAKDIKALRDVGVANALDAKNWLEALGESYLSKECISLIKTFIFIGVKNGEAALAWREYFKENLGKIHIEALQRIQLQDQFRLRLRELGIRHDALSYLGDMLFEEYKDAQEDYLLSIIQVDYPAALEPDPLPEHSKKIFDLGLNIFLFNDLLVQEKIAQAEIGSLLDFLSKQQPYGTTGEGSLIFKKDVSLFRRLNNKYNVSALGIKLSWIKTLREEGMSSNQVDDLLTSLSKRNPQPIFKNEKAFFELVKVFFMPIALDERQSYIDAAWHPFIEGQGFTLEDCSLYEQKGIKPAWIMKFVPTNMLDAESSQTIKKLCDKRGGKIFSSFEEFKNSYQKRGGKNLILKASNLEVKSSPTLTRKGNPEESKSISPTDEKNKESDHETLASSLGVPVEWLNRLKLRGMTPEQIHTLSTFLSKENPKPSFDNEKSFFNRVDYFYIRITSYKGRSVPPYFVETPGFESLLRRGSSPQRKLPVPPPSTKIRLSYKTQQQAALLGIKNSWLITLLQYMQPHQLHELLNHLSVQGSGSLPKFDHIAKFDACVARFFTFTPPKDGNPGYFKRVLAQEVTPPPAVVPSRSHSSL